jgi:ABC-type Fe3+/spermidine/putrescine transport system ATPase subunit
VSIESQADEESANALVVGALESVNLDKVKKKEQIKLMAAQRERHEIASAEKKGTLVPRELVTRRVAALDAALKTNMRDMPRRAAARLHAIALSSGPQALEAELEAEISEGLKRSVEAMVGQELL